jgi:hypothetical protein
MSPTLFNVFIDFLARLLTSRCQQEGAEGYGVAFCISGQLLPPPTTTDEWMALLMLLYADDMALLAMSEAQLKAALLALEQLAREWGMSINYPKTQCMIIGGPAAAAAAAQQQPLQLAQGSVDLCSKFTYLGSTAAATGSQEAEISKRLQMAGNAFFKLKKRVLHASGVSLNTKMRIYKAIVVPTLLYGAAECWAPTLDQLRQLDSFNNNCLRSILQCPRRHRDMISNEELHARTRQPPISSLLRKHRLTWLGHVARKPDTCALKQLLFATAPAPKPVSTAAAAAQKQPARVRGRPESSWNRVAQGDLLAHVSEQANSWYKACQGRPAWMAIIGDMHI